MRLRSLAALPLLVILAVVGTVVPSQAANDTIDVNGTLVDSRTKPPKPVPGVSISAEMDGKVVGTSKSGSDGRFSISLPGNPDDLVGQSVTVKLDTSTLPQGTTLTEKKKTSYKVLIKTNYDIPIGYRIGPKADTGPSLGAQLVQNSINGIFLGLLLALGALGLSLVFGTTGLTNFAHGEVMTFGALAAFMFQDQFGWAWVPAVIFGFLLSGVFGYANDRLLWRPLRNRGTGLIAMMIVSIGLAIFLRNVYQYFFGASNHQYQNIPLRSEPWTFGSISVSPRAFWCAVICAVVLLVVSVAVQRTRLGKATRAVSDNPALAASSGIDVNRVIVTVWIVGGALAGLGGILWGVNNGFDYQVGYKILLLVFAAVTLGGLGTIWGTMAGSLIVGLMVELSTIVLPPEIKYVTALVVLILILLIRPQGLLGRAERIG